ncbi:PaaX family transcriptional regulator C-terminal domain-containing protein [Streptomyces sp. NPDC006872]|uniref:PaaX family transcriptional regulator C-terminal domain-containing protein n=1 Tax=Streptomyces sp. NPDC006872 TaxID=3155720 RepID=UPI0033D18E31
MQADPHLPAEHLPSDWPAGGAQRVFRTLCRSWEAPATGFALKAANLVDIRRLRG